MLFEGAFRERGVKMSTQVNIDNTANNRPKVTRTRKRSDAQILLDPAEILSAERGATIDERWRWFSNRLDRAGFNNCGYLISRNDVDCPLSHEESQVYGELVSSEYMSALHEKPELETQARPYRMMKSSRHPITYVCDEDLNRATPKEKQLSQYVHNEFGLKAWAIFPVQAPEKKRFYGLGWWDLEDQKNARHLWEAESCTFTLAATYFAESISALVNDTIVEETPQLSHREMECLLWAGAGKTTGEISAILSVADGTIDEYFKRAAKKLGAATRAQACVKAVLAGLITP